MGYPTKLLNDNEEIVLDLHPHWRMFLAPGGLLVLALVGLIVVPDLLGQNEPIARAVAAVPAVAGLAWFVWRLIRWRSTHFVVTTDRVIFRSGVISKAGQNIPLERINNVAFSQTVLERMLRVGDLVIESAGTTGRQVFDDVLRPSRVENQIYAQIERSKERDDTRAARAGISVADELAKLEELRRQGVIDEQQFQSQKARLLS
ncbi:PH domain-containing protein [soil metagenome]